MHTRTINPTSWLQAFNINQGIEITAAQRTLYLSGQTSTDDQGTPQHAGDIAAQFRLAWANLRATLEAADMAPANIVRLNVYTTDVDAVMGVAEELYGLIGVDGCHPVSTLLGVARLFDPAIMIELEAIAVA